MEKRTRITFIKSCFAVGWLSSTLCYVAYGNAASAISLWFFAIAAALVYILTTIQNKNSINSGRWGSWILLLLSILSEIWAFLGLLEIHHTKYELVINPKIIDSWISGNIGQTICFSCVVLCSMIMARKSTGAQSRLLTCVNMLFMLFAIIVSAYILIMRDTFLNSTWREWSDYAWIIQQGYNYCIPLYLFIAFGRFLYRLPRQ